MPEAQDASRIPSQQIGQCGLARGTRAGEAARDADERRRRAAVAKNQTVSVTLLTGIALRILVELTLAPRRAEVVGLAFVLALAGCLVLVDLHLAHGVGDHRILLIARSSGAGLIGSSRV